MREENSNRLPSNLAHPLLIVVFLPNSIWDNLGDYVFNPEQKSAVMERKDSYFPQPEHREVRA